MKYLLRLLIALLGIIAFCKGISLIGSTRMLSSKIYADNKDKEETESKPIEVQKDFSIKDTEGNVIGNYYNVDTMKIQQLNTCSKLYDLNFSPEEVNILQTLRLRSEKLREKEKDLELKEEILHSIRMDIESKLDRLENMTSALEDTDEGKHNSYARLVKIYESMKPKEAAKIFNTLQMSVVLGLAKQMKENKLSAIVAEMSPDKARDLTMALANRRT